jgi:hypothetical protein
MRKGKIPKKKQINWGATLKCSLFLENVSSYPAFWFSFSFASAMHALLIFA